MCEDNIPTSLKLYGKGIPTFLIHYRTFVKRLSVLNIGLFLMTFFLIVHTSIHETMKCSSL